MIFVFSWDDGSPSDMRLSSLMQEYGIKGTFFIPKVNSEGRNVLSPRDIRTVGGYHEIAGHTRDHVYLAGRPYSYQYTQICDGNSYLEEVLGRTVDGFCYPGGRLDKVTLNAVEDLGLKYARTTVNFDVSFPQNKFRMGTTLQFYPHSRFVRLWNLYNFGDWRKRWAWGSRFIRNPRLADIYKLDDMVEKGVFHIWGHSWEIDDLNLWAELEKVFRWIHSNSISTITVSDLAGFSDSRKF